jgi:PKD repeat protein
MALVKPARVRLLFIVGSFSFAGLYGSESEAPSGQPPPVASYAINPAPGVAGLSVLFDAQGSDGPFPITSYDWDWEDDGTFEPGTPVETHIFETPGTYTTRLRITDSAGQVAETTHTVAILAVGELSRQVIVNPGGSGDGLVEIRSSQPGFAPVRCSLNPHPETCSATVQAGHDITLVAENDPAHSIFSGWPDGFRECSSVVTSTMPMGTRSECHFVANNFDRTFEATFQVTPPATHRLTVSLRETSSGAGEIFSLPGTASCSVEYDVIRSSAGLEGECVFGTDPGSTLTVIAVPTRPGSRFLGWEGCDSEPSSNECSVAMHASRAVSALFSE